MDLAKNTKPKLHSLAQLIKSFEKSLWFGVLNFMLQSTVYKGKKKEKKKESRDGCVRFKKVQQVTPYPSPILPNYKLLHSHDRPR